MTLDITATVADISYSVNLRQPRDISIPVRFDGEQVHVFGAPPARRETYKAQGFVGDVRKGGSCNCDIYSFAPHTSGTHTECVGHIASVPITVHEILEDSLIPATLITITPQRADETRESYDPAARPDDRLITRQSLEKELQGRNPAFVEGLVIRTLPNGPGKRTQDYSRVGAPFFSIEGMRYLNELGVKHLLADIPSVDRMDDEGKLTNHHIFWDVPAGQFLTAGQTPSRRTITELIYVPDDVADGVYVLNLQIAPFLADASPSRPILYPLAV